ncbi:hypothetical protein ACU4IU_09565 [Brevibacterium sp. CSND-B09]|uniref:hypothetical protein n=1 Tax=Brevibacterium sp. CSND-B09 TaxID=3462571 RepID=UPI00406A836F
MDECIANHDAVSKPKKTEYTITMLSDAVAEQVMTPQYAAYVAEPQAHHDLDLPTLTQSLEELSPELNDPDVAFLGV